MSKWLSLVLAIVFFSNAVYVTAITQPDFAVYLSYALALLLASYSYFEQKIFQLNIKLQRGMQLVKFGFIAWLLSFIVFCVYLQQLPHTSPSQPLQALMIFGGGIENHQPSPALKMRLDRGLQLAQHHPALPILVTGGQASSKTPSEASVMKNYLVEHGIHASRIVMEQHSRSTETNLSYSSALLTTLGLNRQSHIALISSDFHLARIAEIARQQGYRHFSLVPAPTPHTLMFNAYLREYFAYASGFILNEY